MKLLIVEDHPKLRENIMSYLSHHGYLCEGAIHGQEALEKIALGNYDLIILDSNLPLVSGEEFLQKFREKHKNTPVISLTSNSMLSDKLTMFESGVDDYMTKPFELAELLMRVQALLKRSEKQVQEIIQIGNVEINISSHQVRQNGKKVELTHKLYMILELLARNRGIPLSKNRILESVWGEVEENLNLSSTTLEAHISTLRKKLGKEFIHTMKGTGYLIP